MNEIRRAADAERLMNEPLLKEAFEQIESALLSRMRTVDVGALETHRDLIVSMQLLGKVKQYIEQVILTGKLVEAEEARKPKRSTR